MESRKFFHEYLVTQGKNESASQNIPDFTKVLSQNIYFGTEFKKNHKSFCHKSLELYGM